VLVATAQNIAIKLPSEYCVVDCPQYMQAACSQCGLFVLGLQKAIIPNASEIERKAISKLVQKCLDAKGVGCEAWEKEIDVRVAKLYGFEDNYDLN
jgi:hypothetical protein